MRPVMLDAVEPCREPGCGTVKGRCKRVPGIEDPGGIGEALTHQATQGEQPGGRIQGLAVEVRGGVAGHGDMSATIGLSGLNAADQLRAQQIQHQVPRKWPR